MRTKLLVLTFITAGLVPVACTSPKADAESVTFSEARGCALIEEVEGLVRVARASDGAIVEAEEDMELAQGDGVTTLEDGAATISFMDDHLVKLSENSTILVAEVRPRSASGSLWARIKLMSGGLFASLGELTGEDAAFAVETPTAVAAVKGTTFSVESSGEDTTVSVLEGAVDAASATEDGKWGERVSIAPGNESVIRGWMKERPAIRRIPEARRKIIGERMKAMRENALRYRQMRKSGGLDRVRQIRHLARQGKLDQASPELKKALKNNPKLKERLQKQAERRKEVGQRLLKREESAGGARDKIVTPARPVVPQRKAPAPGRRLPRLPAKR